MAKYFLVFKNTIFRQLIYRSDTVIFFFAQFFVFIILFYLWSSVYRSGNQIGSYSLNDFLLYYLLMLFFHLVIKTDIVWRIEKMIVSGELNSIIVKPISFLYFNFFTYLGEVVLRGAIYTSTLFFLSLFLKNNFLFSFNLEKIFYFFLFLFLAILIEFLFFYIIGLSSFWLGLIWGFSFAMTLIVNFFEGSVVPLDLLPDIVLKISDYLPFKYILFVPISIFLGKIDLSFGLFLVPCLWVIILYFLSIFMLKKGLKKYEGYGA